MATRGISQFQELRKYELAFLLVIGASLGFGLFTFRDIYVTSVFCP